MHTWHASRKLDILNTLNIIVLSNGSKKESFASQSFLSKTREGLENVLTFSEPSTQTNPSPFHNHFYLYSKSLLESWSITRSFQSQPKNQARGDIKLDWAPNKCCLWFDLKCFQLNQDIWNAYGFFKLSTINFFLWYLMGTWWVSQG